MKRYIYCWKLTNLHSGLFINFLCILLLLVSPPKKSVNSRSSDSVKLSEIQSLNPESEEPTTTLAPKKTLLGRPADFPLSGL